MATTKHSGPRTAANDSLGTEALTIVKRLEITLLNRFPHDALPEATWGDINRLRVLLQNLPEWRDDGLRAPRADTAKANKTATG